MKPGPNGTSITSIFASSPTTSPASCLMSMIRTKNDSHLQNQTLTSEIPDWPQAPLSRKHYSMRPARSLPSVGPIAIKVESDLAVSVAKGVVYGKRACRLIELEQIESSCAAGHHDAVRLRVPSGPVGIEVIVEFHLR